MDMNLPPLAPTPAPADATQAFQRGLRDLPREHGFERLHIDGALPPDLHGTLYLNGPGLFSSFGRPYRHWFDGDGAMSAIRFDGDGAHGAVRIVMTRQLAEERRAGRMRYTSGATPAPQWHRRIGMRFKNPANTKPLCWNDRLFALFEAGLPTELDPSTLETLGETDLDGTIRGHFCAHFHEVPARRAYYNFSLTRGRRNTLNLYEMPFGGTVRRIGTIALPKSAAMVHDFIVTENHLVFFIPPVGIRILPILAGMKAPLDAIVWRPEEGTTVLVVPIDAPERHVRFEADAFFQYHFMNAHELGHELVVDFVRVGDFGKAFGSHMIETRTQQTVTEGRLCRAVVGPQRRQLRIEQLNSTPCEFPQVAPAAQARAQRYGYLLASNPDAPQTAFARYDFETARLESVAAGDDCFPGEAVFAPRLAARHADDGYLLSMVYDARSDRSFIAVLDAGELQRGPIARCWFDHHVPRPLHGTWRAAEAGSAG